MGVGCFLVIVVLMWRCVVFFRIVVVKLLDIFVEIVVVLGVRCCRDVDVVCICLKVWCGFLFSGVIVMILCKFRLGVVSMCLVSGLSSLGWMLLCFVLLVRFSLRKMLSGVLLVVLLVVVLLSVVISDLWLIECIVVV